MKTWIRKRIDISTKDLFKGLKYCLMTGSGVSVTSKIQSTWEKDNQQSFICLSVRTGFDLLFEALDFERGSEVLMTALTIPDMPKIIVHHGLVPVPVDLGVDNLGPSVKNIEDAITAKTKAIVIAHLFGGIIDPETIIAVTKKHNLLIIEDCAQSYYSVTYSGNPGAHISMFSFGTIKTATALGGGILIFRNNSLLVSKMQNLYHAFPMQSRLRFFIKLSKYLLIKFLSSPRVFPVVVKLLERNGIDYDSYIHNLSRSFPSGNLFQEIRKQPCFPLLKLMLHRFESYKYSTIEKRIERGNFLRRNLPEKYIFPGHEAIIQTYWAFPVLTPEPQKLIDGLRKAGFDATRKISLKIVENDDNSSNSMLQGVKGILNQIVFIPLYPEMPFSEFERMAKCLEEL